MNKFRIIVETIPGLLEPSIAIAGSRAGGIGVLNLEFFYNSCSYREQIEKLSGYAVGNDFGVKFDQDAALQISEIANNLPKHLRLAVLSFIHHENLQVMIGTLRGLGIEVIVECTTLQEAQAAIQAGTDGVIAKGHEAGGRIGDETTFILLQRFLQNLSVPVWAKGGIGIHTAAACFTAGAAGIVLDSQMVLTRESSLPRKIKDRIAAMDGSETMCLGDEIGHPYRVCSRIGMSVIKKLQEIERNLLGDENSQQETVEAWHEAVAKHVGCDSPESQLFLCGQDIAFAASLAKKYVTVGGILDAIWRGIDSHCRSAYKHRSFGEGSALAASHGTRYPVVQGPMARVSDVPAFANEIAKNGGLPFLAASWMNRAELDTLMQETETLLHGKVWGVGLLGFLPPEVYNDQIQAVLSRRPPFALIAGGQAYQVKGLEKGGIPTYLHVPSLGLMRMFLNDGIKRFVLEGRESGGHVGPLSSFVLWNLIIDLLLEYFEAQRDASSYHLLFAGGIHDSMSASMVAMMAAPLAERGVCIGVQLGSAYLFCRESIATGAILEQYQQEAMRCGGTRVLETGPGHAERCMETPFVSSFKEQKLRLIKAGASAEKKQQELDLFMQGRLLIASKGIHDQTDYINSPQAQKLVPVTQEEQYQQGNYLIGQAAALRSEQTTIDALHRDVTIKAGKRVAELYERSQNLRSGKKKPPPSDVAIIGMACLLPKAPDLQTYWENIHNKVDAITEIPKDRWDWQLYYDPDNRARDKIISKWGGFLDTVPFDPVRYGMPPNSLSSIEPLQLLTLETVRLALMNAGYAKRPFAREHTSVILGISGTGDLSQRYGFRSALPVYFGSDTQKIYSHFKNVLPEWTEDSFPGILANVAAGRVANRFDLGGVNFSIDAACASSLAALYLGVRELEHRTSDMVIVGGADTLQNPFTYLCFSKTQALSPQGKCRAFDTSADGTVLGEGIAVVILKRLADAERDGDRIYAVIKGIGAGSDGRDRSLTAPRLEGQMRTLERAYAKAGLSPSTISLIEAHGTGTVIGDQTEIQALARFFSEHKSEQQSCAVGSVKSMIGHTKSAAGIAALIKASLALYHKVLPPTNGVEHPDPAVCSSESPIYINTRPRPWIHHAAKHPRRAGVSAFGFGGTNFHTVLEEYTRDFLSFSAPQVLQNWPSELLVWKGSSRQALLEAIKPLATALEQGANLSLSDLAFTLAAIFEQSMAAKEKSLTLTVVASSLDDLKQKLNQARDLLITTNNVPVRKARGVYFSDQPLSTDGKVAFLFPGQGSQYLDMLCDLAIHFPSVRERFERSDRVLQNRIARPLSSFIFPSHISSDEEKLACQESLAQTNIAQPAMGTADLAMFHLLEDFGIRPDIVAGHSYGEYVALCAAGVIGEDDLITLSEARGRFIVEAAGTEPGTMAAVRAGADAVSKTLQGIPGIEISNLNAPEQTVISGPHAAVREAVQQLKTHTIPAQLIRVSCAFHSSIVAPACKKLEEFLSSMMIGKARLNVFSNTNAALYPAEPKAICQQLVKHLVSPVQFIREVEAIYEAGARLFVEVGPGRTLKGLVDKILGDKPYRAIVANQEGSSGLTQLQHLLGELAAHGVPVTVNKLYEGRALKKIDLKTFAGKTDHEQLSPTTWLVNGSRAIPPAEATAAMLGQRITPMQLTPADKGAAPVLAASHQQQFRSSAPDGLTGVQTSAFASESNKPGHRPSANQSRTTNGSAQVMARFQQMMSRFLDTQKSVMLTYLNNASAPVRPFVEQTQDNIQDPSTLLTAEQQDARVPSIRDRSPATTEQPPTEQMTTQASFVSGIYPADEKGWLSQLLEIVSERTGYPPEMLNVDLDLEADLGIDSIKRIEIVGTFLKQFIPDLHQDTEKGMQSLSGTKTLRGIIEKVQEITHAEPANRYQAVGAEAPATVIGKDTDHTPDAAEEVHRFTRTPVTAFSEGHYAPLTAKGVIVVTDDEQGIAQSLINELKKQGLATAMVRLAGENEALENCCYRGAFNTPEGTAQLLEIIRERQGPIGGLIHLIPLKKFPPYNSIDFSGLKERFQLEVKSLFYLIKDIEKDLDQVKKQGEKSCILSATAMGGNFGLNLTGIEQKFFPGQGCVSGLLKTVAIEWPDVRVKAVDINIEEPVSALAKHLLSEINSDDAAVEVGYEGSTRLVLMPTLTPLNKAVPGSLPIDSSWVILATGGARGITAEVVCELARNYKPTLILVGSSPLPPDVESADTAELVSVRDLKAALIARKIKTQTFLPTRELEQEYRALCKEREIRSNLAAMRKAGAQVEYFQADVRDEHAFGDMIDQIYQSYGKIDGVIHGAGIIKDKFIRDKTPESFDQVFGTKTEGAFILSRKLRPESLRFFVLFSSVAGVFGNQGQGDYAAANEFLNKLALYLDKHWPGRVVSINWGPWETKGMVSDGLQKHFAQQGIQLIPISMGKQKLIQELCYGQKGDVEIIIGGVVGWKKTQENQNAIQSRTFPLIIRENRYLQRDNGSAELIRTLNPSCDSYLRDHQLDGNPVLPAAFAMELMAEVVAQGWPEFAIVRIRDISVLKGLILKNGPETIRVVARQQPQSTQKECRLRVLVEISNVTEKPILYYRGIVELHDTVPIPPLYVPRVSSNPREFPMQLKEAYNRLLFHGPTLQCISEIKGVSDDGISAIVKPSDPQQCIAGLTEGDWLIDPVVVDGGFQLAILWARVYHDFTPLPSRFPVYHRFGSLSGPFIMCYLHTQADHSSLIMHTDLYFVSSEGYVLGLFEGAESTCSRALNRFIGNPQNMQREKNNEPSRT